MIPSTDSLLLQELDTAQTAATLTFGLKTADGTAQTGVLQGMVDGKAALQQTIRQILNTERYDWLIFSWNYGVELRRLIGKDPAWCVPVLEQSIREALLQDDRITGVTGFSFEIEKKKIAAAFTVQSIYGDVESSLDADI